MEQHGHSDNATLEGMHEHYLLYPITANSRRRDSDEMHHHGDFETVAAMRAAVEEWYNENPRALWRTTWLTYRRCVEHGEGDCFAIEYGAPEGEM